jgi:hypothetical protein
MLVIEAESEIAAIQKFESGQYDKTDIVTVDQFGSWELDGDPDIEEEE